MGEVVYIRAQIRNKELNTTQYLLREIREN